MFDLDPPDPTGFPLAIQAALEMNSIFESLDIVSYPKLSGSKGLQIHIPLGSSDLSYTETRAFTSFIAEYLIGKFPNNFTIERLKKDRGQKLYIDYLQHGKGKTIIAPYSARGKSGATVAAPLDWNEINDTLDVRNFTIPAVKKTAGN